MTMYDFKEFFKFANLKLRMTFLGCSPLFLSDMMMFGGCSSFFDDGFVIYNTDTVKEMENTLIKNDELKNIPYDIQSIKDDKICSTYYSIICSLYSIKPYSVSIAVNSSLYKEGQRKDRKNVAYITICMTLDKDVVMNSYDIHFNTKNRYEQEKELVVQTLESFRLFLKSTKGNINEPKPNDTN